MSLFVVLRLLVGLRVVVGLLDDTRWLLLVRCSLFALYIYVMCVVCGVCVLSLFVVRRLLVGLRCVVGLLDDWRLLFIVCDLFSRCYSFVARCG